MTQRTGPLLPVLCFWWHPWVAVTTNPAPSEVVPQGPLQSTIPWDTQRNTCVLPWSQPQPFLMNDGIHEMGSLGQTDRTFICHLVWGKLELKVTDKWVTTRYLLYRSLTPPNFWQSCLSNFERQLRSPLAARTSLYYWGEEGKEAILRSPQLVYNLAGCQCKYYVLKWGYWVINFHAHSWLPDPHRADLAFPLLDLFEKC